MMKLTLENSVSNEIRHIYSLYGPEIPCGGFSARKLKPYVHKKTRTMFIAVLLIIIFFNILKQFNAHQR